MNFGAIRKVSPSPSALHVSQPLSNVSLAYRNAQDVYVADRIFPVVRVSKQFDQYYIWGDSMFLHSEVGPRAPGSEARRMDMQVSSDTFKCLKRGLAMPIFDEQRANADPEVNPEVIATEVLTDQALLEKDLEFIGTAMKVDNPGASWTLSVEGHANPTAAGSLNPADTAGTNNKVAFWDDNSSEPIELIREMKRRVQLRGRRRPNKMVMGRAVYDALIDHSDFLGRINQGQTSGAAVVMLNTLTAVLELQELWVMDGVQDKADEGESSDLEIIGNKQALLLYSPLAGMPTNGGVPSAGYTFEWDLYSRGRAGFAVKSYRDEKTETDVMEINSAYDQKIVGKNMAVKFDNIVSAD